jgi:hypothetical protein
MNVDEYTFQHIISYSAEAKFDQQILGKLDNKLHHKICDTIKLKFDNYKIIRTKSFL